MEVIENPSVELWEDVSNKCDYATFFHTPTWARILESTYPDYEIATKGFIFDDGVRVILPLMQLKRFKKMARSYFSMPFNLYGGIISDGKDSDDKRAIEVFEYMLKGNMPKSISIAGNPFYCYDLPDKYESRNYFTQIINLDYGYEAIYSRYRHNVRKNLKKAERNNVYEKIADSLKDYEDYFKIYEKVLRQWKDDATSEYEFDLFANIYKLAGDNAKLWLVCHEDKVVGGILVFYNRWHSVGWHAAYDSDYYDLGISNFLFDKIIKDATEKGFKIYDFNPSGGHEGVVKFKEHMGAEQKCFRLWQFHSVDYRMLKKISTWLPGRIEDEQNINV